MLWRKITTSVIVGVVTALSIYDGIGWYYGGVDATISRVVYSACKEFPVIAFAAGVLCGHFFWPQEVESTPRKE